MLDRKPMTYPANFPCEEFSAGCGHYSINSTDHSLPLGHQGTASPRGHHPLEENQMKPIRSFVLLLLSLSLFGSVARADVVSDWNLIAVQAGQVATAPPGPQARVGPSIVVDVAMVHAAVYDAVQAIERKYEPYYVEVPGASGSPIAAAARAAHDILVSRYPDQAGSLGIIYQNYLASNGIALDDPGIAVGEAAAAGIIAMRSCDGSFPDPPTPFIGGTGVGEWRPTTAGTTMAAPWLANTRPFMLTRPSQFRSDPPPPVGSQKYVKDYIEVMNYGSANSNFRTDAQTDMAFFWAGNTPAMMNQFVRNVAGSETDNVADSSRLFAFATMSMADAIIACWNDKIQYNYWRPITAIRTDDGFARTPQDPAWTSLIAAPPYPDYTSGANAIGAATVHALEHALGTDRVAFTLTTTNTGPTSQDTRTFTRLSQVADELVDARIYLGIHFRFADTAARKLGRSVANYGNRNYFRPTTGRD